MRQSGPLQAIGNPADVILVGERLPRVVIAESVARIDLHKLAPDALGFFDFAEMAQGGGKDLEKLDEAIAASVERLKGNAETL